MRSLVTEIPGSYPARRGMRSKAAAPAISSAVASIALAAAIAILFMVVIPRLWDAIVGQFGSGYSGAVANLRMVAWSVQMLSLVVVVPCTIAVTYMYMRASAAAASPNPRILRPDIIMAMALACSVILAMAAVKITVAYTTAPAIPILFSLPLLAVLPALAASRKMRLESVKREAAVTIVALAIAAIGILPIAAVVLARLAGLV